MATPHQSQEPNSRAQSKVFPSGNQGGLCWLHTHHSSDPVTSALFALFLLMTFQYLPETRIFSLKTAKMKHEHCVQIRCSNHLWISFLMNLSVPRGWILPPLCMWAHGALCRAEPLPTPGLQPSPGPLHNRSGNE